MLFNFLFFLSYFCILLTFSRIYNVTITTQNGKNSGTSGSIYINILGDTNLWSEYIEFNDFFDDKSTTYALLSNTDWDITDVGSGKGISMVTFSKDAFKIAEITLDNLVYTNDFPKLAVSKEDGRCDKLTVIFIPSFNYTIEEYSADENKCKLTQSPTKYPTNDPSNIPTITPSNYPTITPTNKPSNTPTQSPTNYPSYVPSDSPTKKPSYTPTELPTQSPTNFPSYIPSYSPFTTLSPSVTPSKQPTIYPTNNPAKISNIEKTFPSNSPTEPCSSTLTPTTKNTSQPTEDNHSKMFKKDFTLFIIIGVIIVFIICVLISITIYFYRKYKQNNVSQHIRNPVSVELINNVEIEDIEMSEIEGYARPKEELSDSDDKKVSDSDELLFGEYEQKSEEGTKGSTGTFSTNDSNVSLISHPPNGSVSKI